MSDEASLTSIATSSSSPLLLSPATRDFLAGLGAGVASVIVGQPLDTLRVHEQAAAAASGGGGGKAAAAARNPSAGGGGGGGRDGGGGPLATARRLLSPAGGGGPHAFWRGVAYPAATIGFQSAIVFQAYGMGCRFLAGREEGKKAAEEAERASAAAALSSSDLSPSSAPASSSSSAAGAAAIAAPLSYSSVFLAGTVSGAAQLAVIVPVDLLKIRAQLSCPLLLQGKKEAAAAAAAATSSPPSNRLFSSTPLAAAVSSAWRDGGRSIRGLYRGGLVTALRDVPSHGVYFACYELCRELLDPGSRSRSIHKSSGGSGEDKNESENESKSSSSSSSSSLALLAAGGIAGAASWLSIYPLDTIKTRVQAATLLGGGGVGGGGGGGVVATTAAVATPLPSATTALRDAIKTGGHWNGLSSTLVSCVVLRKF